MTAQDQAKRDLLEIGKRLHRRGYNASSAGNFSIRLTDDLILITPTGFSKGFLTAAQIVAVSMAGEKVSGALEPSSELPTHLRIYGIRKDVKGIVHAHPPVATAFGIAGIPLDRDILPEVILTIGRIPLARYETPSTEDLADTTARYIRDNDAVLMSNHGALTVGTDIYDAYYKMETFEHFAMVSLITRVLGRENVLSASDIAVLGKMKEAYRKPSENPI
jgi:L-fuculose-phosphate aldolase